jgi:hypothetical protein
MHIPQPQERAFVQGRSGLFLVLRVNHDKRLADLIAISSGSAGLEENVPLTVIRPFRENLPM